MFEGSRNGQKSSLHTHTDVVFAYLFISQIGFPRMEADIEFEVQDVY